jgi:hypothetical protein
LLLLVLLRAGSGGQRRGVPAALPMRLLWRRWVLP